VIVRGCGYYFVVSVTLAALSGIFGFLIGYFGVAFETGTLVGSIIVLIAVMAQVTFFPNKK
jgi:hypothetical protein